jgi:drug/metabolite transporter (DMT)-like permease
MLKLIVIGLLSGLFFSATFIINRMMSLEGGHWVWSAALRYGYMVLFLMIGLPLFRGGAALRATLRLFGAHWKFWVMAGSIGFGGFYALICFSADHAPGWVVATTWQLTIIASLFVLMVFGRRFPGKTWIFSGIVFAGVLMVNLTLFKLGNLQGLLQGALPVLVAAFCYPIGNQLVWEAQRGRRFLPHIQSAAMDNPFNKVLLLSLGSLPFWCLLVAVIQPPPPAAGQLAHTALVALFSGIAATSLFLFARSLARRASELAAVDATQSSEVVFALLGEVLILDAAWPTGLAVAGVGLVFGGLVLFIRFQEVG